MERRKVGRSSKTLGILIVAGLLELTGYGPSWIAGWIGAGVGAAIAPFAIELGLAPDYTKFRVIPVAKLQDQSPEILRGLEAYNRKDFEEAYRIWLSLAESGNAEAQYRVGRLYIRGEGVHKSDETAARWFELSALKNHPSSMAALGVLYALGHGVSVDHERSLDLLQRARSLGNPYATRSLAITYEEGRGVQKNAELAIALHREALVGGICSASNDLAEIYLNPPSGIHGDLVTSYRYAMLGKRLGCEFRLLIKNIENQMTDGQINDATNSPLKIEDF